MPSAPGADDHVRLANFGPPQQSQGDQSDGGGGRVGDGLAGEHDDRAGQGAGRGGGGAGDEGFDLGLGAVAEEPAAGITTAR